ncbi:ligand-binding sensor domain-containing protein [Flavobacterium sp.]
MTKKYPKIYTLLLMFVLFISCKQEQKKVVGFTVKPEAKKSTYGPNSMVRNVKQARNGDILVASFGGVLRYDGKTFTNITSSIPEPSFWDVLEDRKGNLWFTSRNSGVYHYDGKSFKQYTTNDGLADDCVLTVFEDKSGYIWFGTSGGASRYDGKSFRNFTTKDGLSNNGVHSFMQDSTGKLWIGTSGDACFYDGQKFIVFKNRDGRAFHNVWGILEDRKGNIWFGGSVIKDRKKVSAGGTILKAEVGLWRYDGKTYTKVSSKSGPVIIQDKKGNIWTAGPVNAARQQEWKLYRYDANTLYDTKPAVTEVFSSDRMLCRILEAEDGSIWFGSGKGVYRYDGKTITNFKNEAAQK